MIDDNKTRVGGWMVFTETGYTSHLPENRKPR